MKKFLSKHKVLSGLLDFFVLFSSPFLIFSVIGGIDDISTSFKTPIFLNAFCLLMFLYVNLRYNSKEKKFKTLGDWAKPFFFINIVALVSHSAIGLYTRNNQRIGEPLWAIDKSSAIKIISLYLLFIAVSGTMILISKRRTKK